MFSCIPDILYFSKAKNQFSNFPSFQHSNRTTSRLSTGWSEAPNLGIDFAFYLYDSDPLFFKGFLNLGNIDPSASNIVLNRDGRSYPGTLAGDGTAHHLADRSVRYFIAGNTAARNQQVLHLLRDHDSVRYLKISPRRGYDDQEINSAESVRCPLP